MLSFKEGLNIKSKEASALYFQQNSMGDLSLQRPTVLGANVGANRISRGKERGFSFYRFIILFCGVTRFRVEQLCVLCCDTSISVIFALDEVHGLVNICEGNSLENVNVVVMCLVINTN